MRRENQGILQLSLITGSFLLGYVPSSGKENSVIFSYRYKNKDAKFWEGSGINQAMSQKFGTEGGFFQSQISYRLGQVAPFISNHPTVEIPHFFP